MEMVKVISAILLVVVLMAFGVWNMNRCWSMQVVDMNGFDLMLCGGR